MPDTHPQPTFFTDRDFLDALPGHAGEVRSKLLDVLPRGTDTSTINTRIAAMGELRAPLVTRKLEMFVAAGLATKRSAYVPFTGCVTHARQRGGRQRVEIYTSRGTL